MYRTDFVKNNEESTSLLDFISEREKALKAIRMRCRITRIAYISAIAICLALSAYVGVLVHII